MKDKNLDIDICLKKISLSKQHVVRTAYDRHYGHLCEYAIQIIHDTQSAQDIVTDSFIKLLENIDQFKAGDQVRRYLYTATNRTCKDYKRQKRINNKRITEFEYLSSLPQENIIETELMPLIADEIMKLPPQRQKILKQLYWEGLTSQQVAERMELSRQTVLNQKVRALNGLRNTLKRIFK